MIITFLLDKCRGASVYFPRIYKGSRWETGAVPAAVTRNERPRKTTGWQENRHPADETIREGGRKTAWKPENLGSETHDDAITRHRVPGKRNRRGYFSTTIHFPVLRLIKAGGSSRHMIGICVYLYVPHQLFVIFH